MKENIENIRHSISHLMSMAVQEIYPDAELGVGPMIENGFYQDYGLSEKISEDILPKLEKRIKELIKKNIEFTQNDSSFEDALEFYKNDSLKTELIKGLKKDGKKVVSFYDSKDFHNLCDGPHVKNTRSINPEAFKLTHLAGAYWKGDSSQQMLTRIYGIAFETKEELDKHLEMLEEAKKRDHKKLGKELDLFFFSPLVGAGLPLWSPKGTLISNILDDFVWELRKERGYEKVEIPHITKKDLYETSGHWDKFKDELFHINTREGHEFVLKPMNCPHHTQIYARKPWSYRDLPQRYANTTAMYRDEQSGELAGLARVRAINIDDAHVFCRKSQIEEEMLKIWDIIDIFYKAVGLGDNLTVNLSFHDPKNPDKYLGDKKLWKEAEASLSNLAKTRGVKAEVDLGEAAFYGPKIDFIATDSLQRKWQVATIQLDMNMPERFDLTCIDEKGNNERIVMIHAAIMGSIERHLAILIEHYAGAFPVWLSPVQVKILAISEKFQGYANKVAEELNDFRVEVSDPNETLGKRIRQAQIEKIPYTLVVGEKEEKEGSVSIRHYKEGDVGEMKIGDFEDRLEKDIKTKKI